MSLLATEENLLEAGSGGNSAAGRVMDPFGTNLSRIFMNIIRDETRLLTISHGPRCSRVMKPNEKQLTRQDHPSTIMAAFHQGELVSARPNFIIFLRNPIMGRMVPYGFQRSLKLADK
ncbi:hypothetical protein TNCT_374311 [Trichonephila clavata]|uniref:Uncharacterized protein n=1 Tax=Trichonephila clavata TaxID=2740835 RepID=A0A8X6J2Y7_TRICU|nr:hypothetical protein TNCT_374311 [Trichonephila clavata]